MSLAVDVTPTWSVHCLFWLQVLMSTVSHSPLGFPSCCRDGYFLFRALFSTWGSQYRKEAAGERDLVFLADWPVYWDIFMSSWRLRRDNSAFPHIPTCSRELWLLTLLSSPLFFLFLSVWATILVVSGLRNFSGYKMANLEWTRVSTVGYLSSPQ